MKVWEIKHVIEQSALRFLLVPLQKLETRDAILVNSDDLAVKNCRVQIEILQLCDNLLELLS